MFDDAVAIVTGGESDIGAASAKDTTTVTIDGALSLTVAQDA